MKRAIDPSEIRAGDLIREEYAEPWHTDGGIPRVAIEYTATTDLKTICRRLASGWFLLHRPEPAVELPTEPTLGWLTYSGPRTLGTFRRGSVSESECGTPADAPVAVEIGANRSKANVMFRVTAFTPATAVPTEALDELRRRNSIYTGFVLVNDFLAAVDAANEATS